MKGQTAIFEEMIEDEDGLVDDRLPTTSRGLWAASETERTLKAILSFAKVKRMDPELVEEGNTFMELFETWKKEYKVCTDMCKTLSGFSTTDSIYATFFSAVKFLRRQLSAVFNERNRLQPPLSLFRCCTNTGWF